LSDPDINYPDHVELDLDASLDGSVDTQPERDMDASLDESVETQHEPDYSNYYWRDRLEDSWA
jgi:hypothetical protein